MSNTSVQTAGTPPAPALASSPPPTTEPLPPGGNTPTASPRPQGRGLAERLLKPLASLQLTVFLFVLSLLLVFFGTLAQIDNGIWAVVERYFRSAIVWVPVQLLVQFGQVFFNVPREVVTAAGEVKPFVVPGSFPFPGGWLIGSALLLNLLAAHLIRFKISWKRSGILLIHAGLILLMLGELVTGLFAVEARMSIGVGETANFTDVSQTGLLGGSNNELAITTPDPSDPSKDLVVVIPERQLRNASGRISDEKLPFDVELIRWWKNSNLTKGRKSPTGLAHPIKASDGMYYGLIDEAESSGVESDAREDYPAAEVAFYEKGGDQKLGQFFVSMWFYPNRVHRQLEFEAQTVKADGKTYTVELRPKREYKDYTIALKEFRHDKYEGTQTAKNFSSLVDFQKKSTGERREVKIYMNNPLRHGGETFFQSGFFPDNTGTVLQVVRNPGWLMPYFSCLIVTLGMIIHFGLTLATFLSQQQRRANA